MGCTDPYTFNYNSSATCDDGSCIPYIYGCTDSTALNYDSLSNTDDGSCFYSFAIGHFYQGGIIFWLDNINGGGLIVSPSDIAFAQWGCHDTLILGADSTAIGYGPQNTLDIINAGCSPTHGAFNTAAGSCDTLTLNGYSDWFLPSKDELNQIYVNRYAIETTAIANGGSSFSFTYWSSTEAPDDPNIWLSLAWSQSFGYNGMQLESSKRNTNHVRAVRAF